MTHDNGAYDKFRRAFKRWLYRKRGSYQLTIGQAQTDPIPLDASQEEVRREVDNVLRGCRVAYRRGYGIRIR